MVCQCGNKEAKRWSKLANGLEWCERCSSVDFSFPDVTITGKPEWNLPDDPKTGKSPVFTSRQEKRDFLKKHGLVECYGRQNGAPAIPPCERPYDRSKSMHETRLVLKQIREMGKDRRRQEYFRIIKERRD